MLQNIWEFLENKLIESKDINRRYFCSLQMPHITSVVFCPHCKLEISNYVSQVLFEQLCLLEDTDTESGSDTETDTDVPDQENIPPRKRITRGTTFRQERYPKQQEDGTGKQEKRSL